MLNRCQYFIPTVLMVDTGLDHLPLTPWAESQSFTWCLDLTTAVESNWLRPPQKKTKYSKSLYPRLVTVWYHRWHSTGIPYLLAQCRRCDCMPMDQVWRTMTGSSRSLIPKLWWCQGCQWWSSSHFVVQMVPKFGFFNDASPSIYTTVSKIIQDVLGHSI